MNNFFERISNVFSPEIFYEKIHDFPPKVIEKIVIRLKNSDEIETVSLILKIILITVDNSYNLIQDHPDISLLPYKLIYFSQPQ